MAEQQLMAAGSGNTKIQAANSTNLQAGILVSVFGIHLAGMLDRSGDGIRVLVCPGVENPAQQVSLATICGKMGIKDTAAIDGVIQYLGFAGGLQGTNVDVDQAFYYYSGVPDDQIKPEKEGDEPIKTEYAISLGMTNYAGEPKEKLPFEIESISFALWNSTRQKVLESMGMLSIGNVLEKYS